MDIRSLKEAGEFARAFGFKSIVYGAAGSAKTPLINTAPRPVLLACEPGLLSMRGSKVPTWEAHTAPKIEEFFDWFFKSKEADNFDTLALDSVTQMCEIYLEEAKKKHSHGLQQYGDMGEKVMAKLQKLYFHPRKHTYLICKQETTEKGFKQPYFPGKMLPVYVPHQFDAILHLGKKNVPIPGITGEVLAFQCNGTYDILARNRTGNLNDYEEPDFGKLVIKAMTDVQLAQ